MTVTAVAELTVEEVTPDVIDMLVAGRDEWRAKITPEAVVAGVLTGALDFERVHRCRARKRVNGKWECEAWEDVVAVRSRFKPVGPDDHPAAAWNAWVTQLGMPERRWQSKADRDRAKAQNRPGLPAPEKGNETANLSNRKRATRARSDAHA